jgi:hypothetical protein
VTYGIEGNIAIELLSIKWDPVQVGIALCGRNGGKRSASQQEGGM